MIDGGGVKSCMHSMERSCGALWSSFNMFSGTCVCLNWSSYVWYHRRYSIFRAQEHVSNALSVTIALNHIYHIIVRIPQLCFNVRITPAEFRIVVNSAVHELRSINAACAPHAPRSLSELEHPSWLRRVLN